MDEAKIKLVRQWLTKSLHDLTSAEGLAALEDPLLDTAIFHCQQAAEKAVKALLVSHDQRFEKTHNIVKLIEMAMPFAPELSSFLRDASMLTPYVALYRYPDENIQPDQEEFDRALAAARKIYDAVLALLPGEVNPLGAGKK